MNNFVIYKFLNMYMHRRILVFLINVIVFSLMNSYRTSNAQESSINLSQDEQCKQIIKVINQSNTRIFNSPPPVPNIPPFLIGLSDEEQQAQEQAQIGRAHV